MVWVGGLAWKTEKVTSWGTGRAAGWATWITWTCAGGCEACCDPKPRCCFATMAGTAAGFSCCSSAGSSAARIAALTTLGGTTPVPVV